MKPRIGVVCTGQIGRALICAIESMHLDADFILSDTLLRDESHLPSELTKVDVLLSSGYLVKALRRVTEKPIIKIEPSLFDILLAYGNAITLDPSPVVILPSESGTPLVSQIQNILSTRVISDYYEKLDDIDRLILQYKEKGHQCIIGSGLVCDRAVSMGMKSVFVYPQESLRAFIQLAYDTALSICKELELNQQMSTIIQASPQGIIFTDGTGHISLCNDLAVQILGVDRTHLIGDKITHFFPKESLRTVFDEHFPVSHLLCSFHGEQYIASLLPILSKGDLSNVMVRIDNVRTIQKQEMHIRNAMAQKGFVAKHRFENLATCSPVYRTLIHTAKKFAQSNDCVVILGETGTGKEVIAQSIHNHSRRANNPFVAVNCSAISENLLESELFGYDEGAFTGARKGGKQGYFEIAHRGTIFLDEIGELSLPLQSKLLRVIQEQQLVHVGGSKVINFDARVIAATNRNLWELVQKGDFREDLYYRLDVLELELPPLRERPEDIFPLFLQFVTLRDSPLAVRLEARQQDFVPLLRSYHWPGNIRELENFVKTLLAIWEPGGSVDDFLEHLQEEIIRHQKRSAQTASSTSQNTLLAQKHSSEFQKIQEALLETGGNYTKAAAKLGISRVTLWRKIKAWNEP